MLAQDLDYARFEKRYQDKERIGAGGFGTVYKVFDHAKNHYVALKVSSVKPEWHKFTLKNEVELVNKMEKHRNIARYDACYRYNTGIAGEMDFAILKFYEDGNLEQFLTTQDLGLYDKKLIVQGILEGVQFLHRNEVIHRDLKAQNILMSREDGVWCPKITDFGLSREVGANVTITNSAVGISYAYAAPEQILNQKIYKNVDLWAIGVMIYRIISGELPFKGIDEKTGDAQSQFELSKKIVNVILPDKYETMPEPYKSMVAQCLVKDPKERVQSADVLLAMLLGRSEDHAAVASRATEPPSMQPPPDNVEEATRLIDSMPVDDQHDYAAPEPPPAPQFETFTYENPNKNVTQVFTPPTPPPEVVEDKPINEEFSVGERGGFNFRHLIILGVVLLSVVLGYYWYANSARVVQAALPAYAGKMAPDIQDYEAFAELDLSPDEMSDDKKRADTAMAIEKLMASGDHKHNYRLPFLKARLLAHQGDLQESLDQLRTASNLASVAGQSQDLKSELLADEQTIFTSISESTFKRPRDEWNQILAGL